MKLFKQLLLLVTLLILQACSSKDSIKPITNALVFIGNEEGDLYAIDANTGQEKWNYGSWGCHYSSPVAANGNVYVGNTDGGIYALDANTGQEKWVFETKSWIVSSPNVKDNVVIVGGNDKNLYSLNAKDGTLIWRFPSDGMIHSSPAIEGTSVYFGTYEKTFYSVDFATGKQNWKFSAQQSIASSPIVVEDIVLFSDLNNVYALDTKTGNQRWFFELANKWGNTSLTYSNGLIYFSDGISLYACDKNGKLNWKIIVGDRNSSSATSPTIENNIVYIMNEKYIRSTGNSSSDQIYQGYLYAYDATTGKLKWSFTGDKYYAHSWASGILPNPSVKNGTLYFGNQDTNLYAIDANNGTLKWKYKTSGYIWGSPCILTSDGKSVRGLGNIK